MLFPSLANEQQHWQQDTHPPFAFRFTTYQQTLRGSSVARGTRTANRARASYTGRFHLHIQLQSKPLRDHGWLVPCCQTMQHATPTPSRVPGLRGGACARSAAAGLHQPSRRGRPGPPVQLGPGALTPKVGRTPLECNGANDV